MNQTIPLAALTALCLLLPSRQHASAADPTPATISGSVRSIQLPELESDLPEAKGREATQAYCIACHTQRYILIQPAFPRATWLAEVTKMRKVFNGPIPEDKVNEIVDYLVAVRGTEGK